MLQADPSGYGHMSGEAAKEKGAGVMADPSGYVCRAAVFSSIPLIMFTAPMLPLTSCSLFRFGHMGGEAAKEKGAGVMADPSGYGKMGGQARGEGAEEEQ